MRGTIVFDFDGTLVDSLPVVIEIAHEVTGGLTITPAEIEALRNMSARDVIKYSGIPYYKIPKLLLRGRKILSRRLGELGTFAGISDVVKTLAQSKFNLCVVSSNSEENIRRVLKREGIEQYFTGVYGNVGLFTKSRVFKVVMRDQKVATDQMIYVGDEVRDIEAAKKAGIPIVSVTWGYNGEQILQKYQPTHLAHTPTELLKILTD